MRATVSLTSCPASLPLAEATCRSRVSKSGENVRPCPSRYGKPKLGQDRKRSGGQMRFRGFAERSGLPPGRGARGNRLLVCAAWICDERGSYEAGYTLPLRIAAI